MLRILLIAILLSGCASHFDVPIETGHVRAHADITWKTYKTFEALQSACVAAFKRANETLDYNVDGCSEWNPFDNKCIIHSQVPQYLDDRRTTVLGHETLHCFTGLFHK